MADIQEYKCPQCGGAINFDINSQKMKCPYCAAEFDPDTLKAYDEDLISVSGEDKIKWETPGKVWQEGDDSSLRVYVCRSCGGEIVGDANLGATSCPYCGTPVVLMGQFAGDLKPDCIIPFKLNKETAKAALKSHYKKKPFTPKNFTDENHLDKITGMYVPFWLFDVDAAADARFAATKVRTWFDAEYVYTETSHFSVIRSGDISFRNVPADGSSKMADDVMESIEPFDPSQALDFQTAYMAGYVADRYDVSIAENEDRVNKRISESAAKALAGTVHGYSSVRTEANSVTGKNSRVRYAMYPVWILNTTWKDNKYSFAMNGQTGKFVGNIPVSRGRFFAKFGILAGIIAAAVFVAEILYYIL